jgi:predicted GNAT superfamily acetyltransferase
MKQNAPALATPVTIRPLQHAAEMSIGVDLQRKIWAYSETDVVPEQMFVVARESGGQVLAAFHDEQPVGFALAFVGIHKTRAHLHSHMVGVIREYQDRGVGLLLKLAQRDDALARGIELIEWTFDPLQLKNAYFNLAKLGAIVRRYLPNVYGRTSSPLHAGLPTDRLVAEWWVRSAHVGEVLSGKRRSSGARGARISIPASIRQICNDDPSRAEHIQSNLRNEFAKHTAEGLAATGLEFTDQQGSYLMEPYEDRIDQTS